MVPTAAEASFPSDLERTVASALLLLSSADSSKNEDSCSTESFDSSGFSASKSEGRSSTAHASYVGEASRDHPLTVVAFVPGYHELKLKIVQKKRSKSIWISNSKKVNTNNSETISVPTSSDSITTTEASSSLASSYSAKSVSNETNSSNKQRKPPIPGHMGCRAAAILRILSNGNASEVRIRQLLGNSPSTSKALRMLLKLQEVERIGAGGRTDPYIYTMAS